jgi:hypothetical protein
MFDDRIRSIGSQSELRYRVRGEKVSEDEANGTFQNKLCSSKVEIMPLYHSNWIMCISAPTLNPCMLIHLRWKRKTNPIRLFIAQIRY